MCSYLVDTLPPDAVQERDKELTREVRRQEKNDDLRKIFAKHANGFHAWLTEARYNDI